MAGQPLSTLGTNGNYMFGTTPLHSRPELMALVANAIAGWAAAEANLGNAFAAFIGSKKPVAMEIYAAFDSFAVQRRMLIAAATNLLPKRYSEIFGCTLTVLERAAKERHKFAHGIWGVSADPKFSTKILLLADPKDFWNLSVARYRHFLRFQKGGDHFRAQLTMPRIDLKLVVAYRKADLVMVCDQMERSYQYATALCLLASAKPPQRRQLFRQLLNQPDIRQVFEKRHPKHAKPKKADPPPPSERPRGKPSSHRA